MNWSIKDASYFKSVMEKLINTSIENRGITSFIAARVVGINDDGTINVVIPPDETRYVNNVINKTDEFISVGDSVELCTKNGKLSNAWVALKHGIKNTGFINGNIIFPNSTTEQNFGIKYGDSFILVKDVNNNLVFSSSGGQMILRPNGIDNSTGETVINTNGDINIGGGINTDGQITMNSEKVPSYREISTREDNSKDIQLYDYSGNKLYANNGIYTNAIRFSKSANTTDYSSSYNTFIPFNNEPTTDLAVGEQLTVVSQSLDVGDRTATTVYGVLVGNIIDIVKISAQVKYVYNGNLNTQVNTYLARSRNGEISIIGATSDLISAEEVLTQNIDSILSVNPGDFLFVYSTKGVASRDIDIYANNKSTFFIVEGLTPVGTPSGGGTTGTVYWDDVVGRPTTLSAFDNDEGFIKMNDIVAGDNISIQGNTISVLTTNDVQQDNTKPITSAAVYAQIGNIEVLLETI